MPDVVSLIRVKRDNERALSEAEIGWLFGAYLAGEIADEQMAAQKRDLHPERKLGRQIGYALRLAALAACLCRIGFCMIGMLRDHDSGSARDRRVGGGPRLQTSDRSRFKHERRTSADRTGTGNHENAYSEPNLALGLHACSMRIDHLVSRPGL